MERHLVDIRSAASLVLASACWGVATVICKGLLSSVSPVTLLVTQLVPSVLLLWSLTVVTHVRVPPWRELVPLSLLGILNPGISYTLSLIGLRRTTASVSRLLWAAEPILIVALGWFLLRERPTLRLLAVTGIAGCGVALVASSQVDDGRSPADITGCALILGGVLCCALYTIAARKIASKVEPLFTVALQQAVGLACALVVWHFDVGGAWYAHLRWLPTNELVWGAMSGVMYYAAAFWLYLRALQRVSASIAGVFLNLIPVFGIGAALIFLDERLTEAQWLGAIMIVVSVFVLFSRKSGAGANPAVGDYSAAADPPIDRPKTP
jgi:drug/metabolite transporter (DMT)-like permease